MASKESKTESKKSKRQKDEKEDNRSTKRRPDSDKNETVDVHSANSWEKVDLGGDERKSKFLRLMGASKKDHQGRFVIGDNRNEHGRTKEEVEKLTEDLEEQYHQGIELVLSGAARRHKGLGFQETNEEDQGSGSGGNPDPVSVKPAPTPVEKSEEEEQPKKKSEEEEQPKKKKSEEEEQPKKKKSEEEEQPKKKKSEEEEQPKKKKKPKKDKDSCKKVEETKSEKIADKPKSKPMLGFVKSSSS